MEEVIKSDPVKPLPGQKSPVVVEVKSNEMTQSVLYLIYLLYKSNLISRTNLKEMVGIVNQDLPKEGLGKFLVNEAAKA